MGIFERFNSLFKITPMDLDLFDLQDVPDPNISNVVSPTMIEPAVKTGLDYFENPCVPVKCSMEENEKIFDDKIAGLTLDEFILSFSAVMYTVNQIVDFIYSDPISVKNLADDVEDPTLTLALKKYLYQSHNNVTNKTMLKIATQHALLYGRAGLLSVNGHLEVHAYNYYTVVVAKAKDYKGDFTGERVVVGYILYDEPIEQAVVDYGTQYSIKTLETIMRDQFSGSGSTYISASEGTFVNLRLDTEYQNPISRLYYDRNRTSNSIFLHKAYNRKLNERGLGLLIFETNTNKGNVSEQNEDITDIINRGRSERKSATQRLKEATKTLVETVRHIDSDGVIGTPPNFKLAERLENTNTPDKYDSIRDEDNEIIAMLYGIQPTLLGLGTLSDRNVSIASVIKTAKDSSITNIRDTFYSQFMSLFTIDKSHYLSSTEQLSLADKAELAKARASVDELVSVSAKNLNAGGIERSVIDDYVSNNLDVIDE